MSALRVEWVTDDHCLSGKTDQEVVRYASECGAIVLTLDADYNPKRFPICTHPGIIRIACSNTFPDSILDCFTKFIRSGHRSSAKHAFVFLKSDGFDLHRKTNKGIEVLPVRF